MDDNGKDLLPPLMDAVLQHAESDYLPFSGVELVTGLGLQPPQEVTQAWVMFSPVIRDLRQLKFELEEAKRLRFIAAGAAGFGPRKAG